MQKFSLIFEKVLFWLILILLVFIPLYPKFPLFNVKGTFVAIRIEDLLIALAIFIWIFYILISNNLKNFLRDKVTQALLLFFFIGALSLFSAIFLTKTVVPHLGGLHYLRRLEFMMLLPLVYWTIKTKKQLVISLVVISAVVFVVNLYALGQEYLNWPVISTTNSEFSKGLILYLTEGARVNSTFAGHYDLAVFLVMVIALTTALLFSSKRIVFIGWSLIIGGLSFFVLVLTAARQSFIAAILAVVISLILTGKKILILALIIVVASAFFYPSQLKDRFISTLTINILKGGQRYLPQTEEQALRHRLNIPTLPVKIASTSAEEESLDATSSGTASDITPGEPIDATQLGVYRSFEIRFNLEWPRAIRAFYKNPFLGTGYSSLGIATDNDLLRSLGEVGLLGTLSFGLVFVEIIKKSWKVFRSESKFLRYFSAGVLSMIMAFLLNSLFIDVFEASKVASFFWIIVGINLAATKFKQ